MREKLIELISFFGDCLTTEQREIVPDTRVVEIADHLLANGVTLDNQVSSSKWIPVTEETPEESTNVLLRIKCKTTGTTAVTVGYCFTYYWCHQPMGLRWFERWRASYEPAGGVLDDSWDVTHWMKLPKEPKEDANG